MKDNRRNRKLNFIRSKNALRLRKSKLHASYKISDVVMQSNVFNIIYVTQDIETDIIKDAEKKWRLKFKLVDWKIGRHGLDQLMEQQTVTFKLLSYESKV